MLYVCYSIIDIFKITYHERESGVIHCIKHILILIQKHGIAGL